VARELTTIAGGPKHVVDELIPLLKTFSKTVIYMGPSGSPQFAKLFNNALLMMNQENLSELLDLAQALKIPLAPLLDVLRSGSASSFALQAIGPSINTANVQHVRDLELKDMRLFTGAVQSIRGRADAVIRRATAGAQGLPTLTALIEP
jgi:3-hydroxyisobutyrate dehydrogenase-like beta-hydroxyacid dehydrogenase